MKNNRLVMACLGLLLTIFVTSCTVVDKKVDPAALASALQSGDRSDAEKQRDAGRKPAEVLAYLGIGEGMSVIDLVAAGGYYTEVLSYAVGSDGTVYSQNPAAVLKFNNGANGKAMTTRLADNRLPNVKRWEKEFTDLGIEPGSLDAALTALNLHDVYNNSPDSAFAALTAVKATF